MENDSLKSKKNMDELFHNEQYRHFIHRTKKFIKEAFPSFSATLNSEDLNNIAIASYKRGLLFNFRNEREIWYYIIYVVYFGIYFDVDPQYKDHLEKHNWNNNNIDIKIYSMNDMIEEVILNTESDLHPLNEIINKLHHYYKYYSRKEFENYDELYNDIVKLIMEFFPIRWSYISNDTKIRTIKTYIEDARKYNINSKYIAIFSIFSIYFGRGFNFSPCYPWAHILTDKEKTIEDREKIFISGAKKYLDNFIAI